MTPQPRSTIRATPSALIALLLSTACGTSAPDADPAVDSAAIAAARADSIAQSHTAQAPMLRDSAEATLASLLENPATASFDSVVVLQPPMVDGRRPMLVVCGRIGGRPGIGGSRTPVRFVYQNRFTVFVEEAANREQFVELWGRMCAAQLPAA